MKGQSLTDRQAGMRPIEKVILRLRAEGQTLPEISARVGKRPGTIDRILAMIELRGDVSSTPNPDADSVLRPLERVVLRMRGEGLSYGEVGNRLGRSGAHIRRIESYANLKLAG